MKTLKRRIGEAYAKYRIRSSRGSSFTTEIDSLVNNMQRAGVVALIINTYFHLLLPIWVLPSLWIAQKIFEYFMGWYDEKHLGWWKFEIDYTQRELNPFQQELLERIKKIESKLE